MTFRSQSVSIKESPQLFEDYLRNFNNIAPYFRWNPLNDWSSCIKERLHYYNWRKEISEILYQQNLKWNSGPATISNIESLVESNSVAVVTGQQVGIFGGPLYTVYKILSTIKLAQHLNTKFDKWKFIPIFWMEIGDNDYREINHFYFLSMANELVRFELPDQLNDYRSVYLRDIPSDIDIIHEKLEKVSLPSEFRNEILNKLRKNYTQGKSFSTAFAEFLNNNFGKYGLVVMDPTDIQVVNLARPLFEDVLEKSNEVQVEFNDNMQNLIQKGYHVQISLNSFQTLLFMENNNKDRSKILIKGEKVEIVNPKISEKITKQDLSKILSQSPEKFTPNVALRPLLQDYLLPTVAYIAGPSEISYAAQLKPLYELFGIVQPIFYPRVRMTLVENRIQRLIEKFSFGFTQLFQNREKIIEEYIKNITNEDILKEFRAFENQIQVLIKNLKEPLIEMDPTLSGSLEKTEKNMVTSLVKLRDKIDQSVKRKKEIEIGQLNKIILNLFPNKEYQERILNSYYYLIKYGPDFIDHIYDTIDIDDWDHQLIFI